MATGIGTGDPRGFNKRRSSEFLEGFRVRQTPEEGRNVVEITIKIKTTVRKPLMIKIIKIRLRNLDNSCDKIIRIQKNIPNIVYIWQ